MIITSRTPPAVAHAMIEANQRTKQIRFFDELAALVSRHQRAGLEICRIARGLDLVGKALARTEPQDLKPKDMRASP